MPSAWREASEGLDCGQGDSEPEPRPPAQLLNRGSLMGSQQGPCVGWQDGKDPVAVPEGEPRGHCKNHLRHFCTTGALSLLVLPKVPGHGQRPGSQTQEAGVGTGSRQAQAGDGGSSQGRPCRLLAGAWVGTTFFALCTNLHSPPERLCLRSKKHSVQLGEKNNNKTLFSLGQEPCFSFPNPAFLKGRSSPAFGVGEPGWASL